MQKENYFLIIFAKKNKKHKQVRSRLIDIDIYIIDVG